MRLVLLILSVTLMMVHNIVPHHHHDEILAAYHHDGGHDHDEDNDDEGLATLLSNVMHSPSTEMAIYGSFASVQEDVKKKISKDILPFAICFSSFINEWPPDLPVFAPERTVSSFPPYIFLLRAPPVA